jgi:hypothetical protein
VERASPEHYLTPAGLDWDQSSAHSAVYDAERTAEIFCLICNRMKDRYRDAQERARVRWGGTTRVRWARPDDRLRICRSFHPTSLSR